MNESLANTQQKTTTYLIDSHLFVQALAFCAFHIDSSSSVLILEKS